MRSDPLDVAIALRIGRGTLRTTRRKPALAIGDDAVALSFAAGVLEPSFGLMLRPEIAALSMSASSLLVAVNALVRKRLRLPAPAAPAPAATGAGPGECPLPAPTTGGTRRKDLAWEA